MREYRLLISHVGKDRDVALKIVKVLESKIFGEGDEAFKIVPVYMESETDGCFGDFMAWSARAVKSSDGVLALVTENTAEKRDASDVEANVKVVYDEISFARAQHKDIIVLRKSGVVLEDGFELLLQNIKCESLDGEVDAAVRSAVADVVLHAKHRMSGSPLLEYAGKRNAELVPSSIEDTSDYLGRSNELKEIGDCFAEGKRIVCITGFGGIGKTTLAKMYAKTTDDPVVIQYCSAEEASLKNAVINLGFEYDIPDFDKLPIEEKYAARIKQLRGLDRKTLIIIDNFNADFGANCNRDAITDFSSLDKCSFIISSRLTPMRKEIGVVKVGKLDDDELTELFYRDSNCERTPENDKDIRLLIARTNGHTMTVELAAKAVGIDENGVTPKEIADGLLSADAVTRLEDRHDGYDEYDTIYAHLRMLFGLSGIDEAQKKLLGALGFVSRRGLTVAELKANVEYDAKDLIRLCALGYISKSDDADKRYYLHPLMSDLAFSDFVTDYEPFKKIIVYLAYDKIDSGSNDSLGDLEARLDYAEHICGRLSVFVKRFPCVSRILAISYCNAGDILKRQGDIAEAERRYKKGYAINEEAVRKSGTAEARRDLSLVCNMLGGIARAKGDIAEAERYFKQGFEMTEAILKENSTLQARRDFAISCSMLGDIAKATGNLHDAEEYYVRGYEITKEISEESGTIEARRDLSIGCNRLGDIVAANGKTREAETYYRQGYDIRVAIVKESGTVEARWDLSISCCRLGDYAMVRKDIAEAENYYTLAHSLNGEIAKEVGTIEARRELALSCNKLGDIAMAKKDLPEAEKYYIRGFEITKKISEESGTIEARRDLFISYSSLGDVAKARRDLKEAMRYYELSYEIAERIATSSGTIESRRDLSICINRLGDIALATGDIQKAEMYYKKDHEISEQIAAEIGTIGARQDLSVCCNRLGNIALKNGDIAEAERYFKRDLELAEQVAAESDTLKAQRDVYISCNRLGKVYMEKGDTAEAERCFRRGYEVAEKIVNADGTADAKRDLYVSCIRLTDSEKAKGDMENAVKYCKQGYDLARAIVAESNTVRALDDLVFICVRMAVLSNQRSYMLEALNAAKFLYDHHADHNKRYKYVAEILVDVYKQMGDEENHKKMSDIIDSIVYD